MTAKLLKIREEAEMLSSGETLNQESQQPQGLGKAQLAGEAEIENLRTGVCSTAL